MAATHADTEPPRAHRSTHTPDAYLFTNADDNAQWLCCHCDVPSGCEALTLFAAWHNIAEHLRWQHNIRRVWIDYSNPHRAAAVQLALPIVLAHNTSRPRY